MVPSLSLTESIGRIPGIILRLIPAEDEKARVVLDNSAKSGMNCHDDAGPERDTHENCPHPDQPAISRVRRRGLVIVQCCHSFLSPAVRPVAYECVICGT